MLDHALKPATTLIIADRAWHMTPKQPRLKFGQLYCLACPSTDGLSMLPIHDSQPAEAADYR